MLSSSLFQGKTILGPMVRICDLSFRTVCEDNGADVVFTEEVVAAKLVSSRREVRRYPCVEEDVIEYVTYEQFKNKVKRSVVLSLHSCRTAHAPVVLQLGAADGAVAARAALQCSRDITAVDINMGCPKSFSVSNGFGAALMRKPEAAGAILRQLHASLNSPEAIAELHDVTIPISFKTRLHGTDPAETVTMLRTILQSAGHQPETPVVHAITLHARLREQRSETVPLYDTAASVVKACRADPFFSGLCFVLNGSVASRADGEKKARTYNFDAAMMARSALCDPTRFACPPSDGVEPLLDEAHYWRVNRSILRMSIRYRKEFKNYKYHLTRLFPEVPLLRPYMPHVQEVLRTYEDCYGFFKLSPEEREEAERCRHGVELLDSYPPSGERTAAKRPREEESNPTT